MAEPSGYGLKITRMLFESEPGLLVCEPGATGRAAASLAIVMGAVLATVLETKGEATYRLVLKELLEKIDESARATQAEAWHCATFENAPRAN